jgi:exosortase A-associated hydrolase 1
MGDSTGEARTFERAGADIRCAIDRLLASVPEVKEVVIWGLCDAASAASIYAHHDPRVIGLVLLNPWVRTQQGIARAHLRHYYLARLFHRSLWQKIARGEFNVRQAAAAFGKLVVDAGGSGSVADRADAPLPDRMLDGLRTFQGRILLILSGNDLTAQEFRDLAASSPDWRRLLEHRRVTRYDLDESNHTFARRDWRNQVAGWTAAWLKSS